MSGKAIPHFYLSASVDELCRRIVQMDEVVRKLKLDIDLLEQRVNAKEAILKDVFAALEDASADRLMTRQVWIV